MILLEKAQLDDELYWHSEEVYNEMIFLHYKGQRLKQVWADCNSLIWGYEVIL